MGKLLKIIFSMVAAAVLLLIIVAALLPSIVDPNDYKSEIETAVKEYTGRLFTISGDLEFSVFPWLGLTTGKLSLSNPDSFEEAPFAEIEEARIKVKVLPLLSKKIEVSSILLERLSLNLVKNQEGIGNWGNLAGSKDAAGKVGGTFLAALTVGDLVLEDAEIIWDDRKTGRRIEFKDIHLNADRFVLDEPFTINLSFSLRGNQPKFNEKVLLTTDVLIDQKLERIELRHTEVETSIKGNSLPGGMPAANLTADIVYNRKLNRMDSDLRINSGNLTIKAELTGTNLDSKPLLTGPVEIGEFNAKQWMQELQLDSPSLQDSTSFEQVALRFDLTATTGAAVFEGIELTVDESAATGAVNIKDFDRPMIRFELDVDEMNVDRYLPPTESAEIRSQQDKPLMPAIGTPSTAVLEGARLLPLERLRSLDLEGEVTIGFLMINNIRLEDVNLKLNAKDGIIESRQAVGKLYQGSYEGGVNMNFQGGMPEMQMNEKLTKIEVEPLLMDLLGEAKMTGNISGASTLDARGFTRSALKSSLSGEIVFSFTDGMVRGFDLQQIIENGQSILLGSTKPRVSEHDLTEYTEIKGTLKLNNGLAANDDFMGYSPYLRVNGQGTADLPTGKLKYKVTAETVTKENAETMTSEQQGIPMIIDVKGTFQKPSYTLMVNEMVPEKKQAELLDQVEKKFGPDVRELLKQWF